MTKLKQYRQPLLWGGLALVTVVFLVAIALNFHPGLRGPDDWRWVYAIPGFPSRYLLPGLLVVGYTAVAIILGRSLLHAPAPAQKKVVAYLVFCTLAIPILQLALLSAESPDVIEQLFLRTVSAGSSGFFSVGTLVNDSGLFLNHYPDLMPTFPVHPQRYPPGIPLLFYASRFPLALAGVGESAGAFLRPYQCTDLTLMRIPNAVLGTAMLQMLLPFFSAFVIFPLFGLARRTLDWHTAVWAVALYPLVPSFALWAGRWDQFFPLLTVAAWYLLVVGLTENRKLFLFVSGLVLSCATFLSFGLVFMLVPLGMWALLWLYSHRDSRTWSLIIMNGLVFVVGLGILWGGVQLLFGTGFFDIWQVSMGYHLGLARSYWTWLGYHLYDFGIFLGLPLALLCLFAFFYALLTARRDLAAFPIAYGIGVIFLNLSGTARGEVARVWIFLTPFAVICAVWAVTRLSRKLWPLILVAGLLALQLLVFTAFLRVVSTGLESVPGRTFVWQRPLLSNPLDIQFEQAINLLDYELEQVGDSWQLTLFWQPETRLDTTYTVFNHLVSETGELVAQQDGMPQNNKLPTTCWQPGEIIADSYTLRRDPDLAAGEYELLTGLYNPYTAERLLITRGESPYPDAVLLEVVPIP